MDVKVTKITDEQIMREACESTFLGKSKIKLIDMYLMEHSPSRTQLFWIKLTDIPLFVSTHILRHHVGSQPFALTHRSDRSGNGGLDLSDTCDEINVDISNLVELVDSYGAKSGIIDNFKASLGDKINKIKEKGGRNAPTNLSLMINAQSLIDMAKYRMCKQASKETRDVFNAMADEMGVVDPDLRKVLVPKCVYRNGLCHRSCGWNKTEQFKDMLAEYVKLFK